MPDTNYVYVLLSEKTGRRYTGRHDLKDRIARHKSGRSKATKSGVPWQLVHSEQFATRSEAVAREKHLKTGRGRDELDQILSAKETQLG